MIKGNGHHATKPPTRSPETPTNGGAGGGHASSRVAGLFDDYSKVQIVLRQLDEAGCDSKKLSVLAKGDLWDQLAGELRGLALVWIPNFGSLVLTGPLAWEMADALRSPGEENGRNPLETVLENAGLPYPQIFAYEKEVQSNRFLLIVQGDQEEVLQAHRLMSDLALRTDLWKASSIGDRL